MRQAPTLAQLNHARALMSRRKSRRHDPNVAFKYLTIKLAPMYCCFIGPLLAHCYCTSLKLSAVMKRTISAASLHVLAVASVIAMPIIQIPDGSSVAYFYSNLPAPLPMAEKQQSYGVPVGQRDWTSKTENPTHGPQTEHPSHEPQTEDPNQGPPAAMGGVCYGISGSMTQACYNSIAGRLSSRRHSVS